MPPQGNPSAIVEAIGALLMHRLGLVVVEHDSGHCIALMLDGSYQLGEDAERITDECWQPILTDLLDALDALDREAA